jgi:hypothetical protein
MGHLLFHKVHLDNKYNVLARSRTGSSTFAGSRAKSATLRGLIQLQCLAEESNLV